jgi:hypothetical protein
MRASYLSILALLSAGCSESESSSRSGDAGTSGAAGLDGASGGSGGGGATLGAGGSGAGAMAGAGGKDGGASAGAGGQPGDCRFRESFEELEAGTWGSGTFGAWTTVYIDSVGIETDGSKVHFQRPTASTSPGETHANLVVTEQAFQGDLDFSVRMKTVAQLRTGSAPNNWEVAWIFWNYLRPEQSYYFVPKPVGWELGKSDDTKADPNGPECDWPTYTNCLYPGAQRFLATGGSPDFAIEEWHTVRVTQSGGAISIWVNGMPIVSVTDGVNVLEGGRIGLYNEDAHVRFDDVCVK